MNTYENKAVLFDLDGVLVDACEWHRVALNKALMHYTGTEISLEEHNSKYNGLPTLTKLEMLGVTDPDLRDSINNLKQKLVLEHISGLTLDLEKVALLSYLRLAGYKLGCVTNSIRVTTESMLRKTGQFDYFDCIITNQDVKLPKPNSEGYIIAMIKLDALPRNTYIVEDSDKGFAAAIATGAKVIRVNSPLEVTKNNIISSIKEFK